MLQQKKKKKTEGSLSKNKASKTTEPRHTPRLQQSTRRPTAHQKQGPEKDTGSYSINTAGERATGFCSNLVLSHPLPSDGHDPILFPWKKEDRTFIKQGSPPFQPYPNMCGALFLKQRNGDKEKTTQLREESAELGYVFAVSVHRVQLLLQVLSVKRFHHSQQQQQQNSATAQEELTQSEIGEICDYFSRRVASEPYDASRVASFITLLTLPISVLREFLKLIAWKKGLAQAQGGDIAPPQKSRIELCLENHAGLNMDGNFDNSSASKSNIHYDRPHNSVDFGLTVFLDHSHIPDINAAGGAAWLSYCVSVRLRYSFGENPNVLFLGMEGSHGGRACWLRVDDWEKCKQRVARMVEVNCSSTGDASQGRLRMVADSVQRVLQVCLQGLREGNGSTGTT
ncbi:unnamed protein product [Ilex paraguariensis]|uniref:Uncharacterized protein n=1 Tax=Ilex paraguariensis TaxID=185542 RepID=A0ABC8R1Q4_9AQUA